MVVVVMMGGGGGGWCQACSVSHLRNSQASAANDLERIGERHKRCGGTLMTHRPVDVVHKGGAVQDHPAPLGIDGGLSRLLQPAAHHTSLKEGAASPRHTGERHGADTATSHGLRRRVSMQGR